MSRLEKRLLSFISALVAVIPVSAQGECDANGEGSASYEYALAIVTGLPEFQRSADYLSQHAGIKLVHVPSMDQQTPIHGKCYWSVTIYTAEITHLHRWNTFYVSMDGKRILVMDAEGNPISLRKLRSSTEGRGWRPGKPTLGSGN